ncbi:MAG TPA: patatin-like phospholipase family protein [Longimicrobiaceae bacterium]|nr:patatin-like phospholipase family protein [Longimicrobiaceae bacterium]
MSEATEMVLPIGAGTGPRTVLVLGGGGMKGIAHIGVWKALEERGVRPDAIIGTSIGALIGACLSGGMGWRELAELARRLKREDIIQINKRALWLGGVRESAVFEGSCFQGYLKRSLPAQSFSELRIPFRFNAVSLVTGDEIWFGTGRRTDVPLAEAVYASCALPIYFPPARLAGDVLVDGGVLEVLPIEAAVAWGAERVIAVDVGSELLPPDPGYFDEGMIAVHDRVLSLNLREQRNRTLENYQGPPMVYVRPEIGHLNSFDFDRTQFFLEEGYRAAREAIAAAEAA